MIAFSCGGPKVSGEECEAAINATLDKLTATLKPEDVAKLTPVRPTFVASFKKGCMEGKFDLNCMKNASDLASLQTCMVK